MSRSRRDPEDELRIADLLRGYSRSPGGVPDDEQPPLSAEALAARELVERLRRFAPLLLGVGLIVWLLSGVYIIGPSEQGVVLLLGREVGKSSPGLHYRVPWPIQSMEKVNVQAIRRLEVGFRTSGGQVSRVPDEALMLTGDENIVEAQVIVQYRVRDPSQFLFRLRDPEGALSATLEVALRSMVGNTTIDDVLTVGRAQLQEDTRAFLQRLMDAYESGIVVTDVKLQVVDPPEQVKDAFHEVVRAREDREKLINQAGAYREDILPKARGQAQQVQRAAEAYREERIIQAQGDTARFLAVLQQYQDNPAVTRDRLYLETIERVLPKLDKVVLDESAPGVLPLLQLRSGTEGMTGTTSRPAPTPAPLVAPTSAAPRVTPTAPPRPAATPVRR